MTKKKILALTMALMLAVTLPLAVLAEVYDLAQGSITVEAREDGQYVSQEGGVQEEKQTTDTVINQTDSDTTSTTNTITIKAEKDQTAEVTISDVNIDVSGTGSAGMGRGDAAISAEGDGSVTIELDGDNTAAGGFDRAGVEKNNNGSLTITDADADGALNATGGFRGAGIGGGVWQSVSDITIEGGDITATGGEAAAGIGGGGQGSGSDITIKGDAQVKATGGEGGAGIGGGIGDNGPDHKDIFGSNITIEGNAQVDAAGGASGAGIGSGKYGSGSSNITIRGNAQVSVKGGPSYAIGGEGVGIGDGGGYGTVQGSEVEPSTDGLTTGSIAYYAPGADKETTAPEKLLHKTASGTIETHTNITMSTTPATCTENAATVYQCSCGETIKVEQPGTALGHKLGAYTSDNNATCTADGTKTAKCIRYGKGGCQESKTVTDEGSKLPHEFGSYVYQNDATCTADGTEIAQCKHCDATDERTAEGTMLAHSFTHYVSNGDATYDSDGTKTAECDYGCGATDTIPDEGSKLTLYRVTDEAGKSVVYKSNYSGSTLTITAEYDYATLTGTVAALRHLQGKGIETIVFITNGATSTFNLADVTEAGVYALTHDAENVAFLLNGEDIGSILK